ncbi:MAG: hypothetical protein ABH840_00535 [Nanoarchaeota archaeon]
MSDLAIIKDSVIKQGYRELNPREIEIDYEKTRNRWLLYYCRNHSGFNIRVNSLLRDAPVRAKKGGIAHELSHIVAEKTRSKRTLAKTYQSYHTFKLFRDLEERNTDLDVVLRGFGLGLAELFEYAKRFDIPYAEDLGLSSEEIRALLNLRKLS